MAFPAFSGTAVIGTTEWSLPNGSATLTPRTEAGVFQFVLDVANFADGDQFNLVLYESVIAAGPQRIVETWTIEGAQPKPGIIFPSLVLGYGWDFTMQKVAGVDRAVSWSLRYLPLGSGV